MYVERIKLALVFMFLCNDHVRMPINRGLLLWPEVRLRPPLRRRHVSGSGFDRSNLSAERRSSKTRSLGNLGLRERIHLQNKQVTKLWPGVNRVRGNCSLLLTIRIKHKKGCIPHYCGAPQSFWKNIKNVITKRCWV